MVKPMKSFVVQLFTSLILMGCGSFPLSTQEKEIASKRFKPALDRATVYIYRTENINSIIKSKIFLNKVQVGILGSNSFLCLRLPEGRYEIFVDKDVHSNVIIAQKTKIYFFEMNNTYGKFVPVEASKALTPIMASRQAEESMAGTSCE